MSLLETSFLAFSASLVVAGLTVVVLAARAYRATERRAMVHLSLGFSLVVAATATTAVSAVLTGFGNPKSLLLVNVAFSTFGYVFVVYSLLSYE